MNIPRILTCAWLVFTLNAGQAATQRYNATRMLTPQGYSIVPTAINDANQVVGYYSLPNNSNPRPCIWSPDGTFVDLPMGDAFRATPQDINNSGIVTGYIVLPSGGAGVGVVWNGGTPSPLAPEVFNYSRFDNSFGNSINDSGVIAGHGTYWDGRWKSVAFTAQGGAATILATDNFPAVAQINNNGWVVGQLASRAVIWKSSSVIDINAAGGTGLARGVNNKGVVTGWLRLAGSFQQRAFIQDFSGEIPGALTMLPDTGSSFGSAINDEGVVVGGCGILGAVWRNQQLQILDAAAIVGATRATFNPLTGINKDGIIIALGTIDFVSGGWLLTPVPDTPVLETTFVNRDDPFATWSGVWAAVPNTSAIHAGDGTGDLVGWRVKNFPAGATLKWAAVQTAGLTRQTIAGPEGVDQTTWQLGAGALNWAPGTYRITCTITAAGSSTEVATDQVVGWRTQEYLVVGQVKPIRDYELSFGRKIIVSNALIQSYNLGDSYLANGARAALLALPADINTKMWVAFQFLRFDPHAGKAPEYVSLNSLRETDKYWMLQSLLNDFPDLVELPDTMEFEHYATLRRERSYRMFGQVQHRYLLDAAGKIAPDSVKSIKASDNGPTKFLRPPELLTPSGTVTVRGVEFDLQGNSEQTLITSEAIPGSGGVFINSANTSLSFYFGGRVGLEGRVPNYALLKRDAPYIYTEIVNAIGPDGRDTRSKIRMSVNKEWRPDGSITGTAHFNEIRIYRRDFADPQRRFRLVEAGHLNIAGQLEAFLLSGSATWPGAAPLPVGDN